jgi:hypothetical protein
MIDFPNAPTTGQIFTAPNGTQWTWDGAKWTQGATSSGFLPLAGGTMTGDIVLKGDATAALNPVSLQQLDAIARYRNRIINGDMSVDQRNGGNLVAAPANSVAYAIDRWKFSISATPSKGNIGQAGLSTASMIPGQPFQYAFAWQTTTAYTPGAADYIQLTSYIEGYNFNDALWGTANAQPVTIEFWVLASVIGTYGGAIQNFNQTRSYVFTYSVPTMAWTKIRVTIPGDTAGAWFVAANAGAAQVSFSLGTGATYSHAAGAWAAGNFIDAPGTVKPIATNGATWYVTGVALMVGAAAANAEPEFRKYSDNLIDCQRYYQKIGGVVAMDLYFQAYVATGGALSAGWSLRIPTMRAAPTSAFAGAAWTQTNVSAQYLYAGANSYAVQLSGAATGTINLSTNVGSFITLDADF